MADNPLEAVYAYVERVYTRMQAGEMLIRCLEEGSLAPVQEMAAAMVLAGAQGLDPLREALSEADQRQAQVQDDLHQVMSELRSVLKSYGVNLADFERTQSLIHLTPFDLLNMLREQGVEAPSVQETCLGVLQNSRDLMANLTANLNLLAEIEAFLQDWLLCVAYQAAMQPRGEAGSGAAVI